MTGRPYGWIMCLLAAVDFFPIALEICQELFNLLPNTNYPSKILPKTSKFAKAGLICCHSITQKYCQKLAKFYPKWRNFVQSGPTAK